MFKKILKKIFFFGEKTWRNGIVSGVAGNYYTQISRHSQSVTCTTQQHSRRSLEARKKVPGTKGNVTPPGRRSFRQIQTDVESKRFLGLEQCVHPRSHSHTDEHPRHSRATLLHSHASTHNTHKHQTPTGIFLSGSDICSFWPAGISISVNQSVKIGQWKSPIYTYQNGVHSHFT